MYILSSEEQQKVIAQYQKDYGRLILEYNKCDKSIASILSLKDKAEALCEEIQYNAIFHKKFFSEENSNFAESMVDEIRKFIMQYLKNTESTDNTGFYLFQANLQNYAA